MASRGAWADLQPLRQAAATVRANRLRSTLGALAIAAAVATITIVVTALDGLASYARVTGARAFGSDAFVVAKVAPGQLSRRELATRLARNPDIRRGDLRFLERLAGGLVVYAPVAQRSANVSAGSRRFENAAVSGTGAALTEIRELGVATGRFFRRDEELRAAPVAVVGADVADALFPGEDPLGRRLRLGGRGFDVVGVQARQGSASGASLDRYVWIPLPTYERVFGAPQTLQIFGKAPRGGTLAAEDRAVASMRARRHLGPGERDTFDLITPEAARSFVQSLSERVSLAGIPISLMALLAAIVVVTNTTLVSVTARTRDIGVRRAVGATRSAIIAEVVCEAVLTALAGGVVGVLSAAAVLGAVEAVAGLPLGLSAPTAAWSLAAAGLSGVAAGGYPARRAASIDVIAALRSE